MPGGNWRQRSSPLSLVVTKETVTVEGMIQV